MLSVINRMRWDSLLRVFYHHGGTIIMALLCLSSLCDYAHSDPLGYLFLLSAAGTLLFGGAALYYIIKAATGRYQKNLRRLYEVVPDLEEFLQKISAMYQNPPINNIWLDSEHIIYRNDAVIDVLETNCILWAYMRQMERPVLDSFGRANYALVFITLQNKKIEVYMRDETHCQGILDFFQYHLPHIVLGYSDQLLDLCNNHFKEFCELSRQKAEAAGQPR